MARSDRLELLHLYERVQDHLSTWGLSVWSLNVLPVHTSFLRYWFLPADQKHACSGLIVTSSNERVNGCCSLCVPVMDL